jgi:hypothetical protein
MLGEYQEGASYLRATNSLFQFEKLLPITVVMFLKKKYIECATTGFAYETVRDFEKFTCQNSCEPHMRLDTNLAFFIYPSNRRFGGANFL